MFVAANALTVFFILTTPEKSLDAQTFRSTSLFVVIRSRRGRLTRIRTILPFSTRTIITFHFHNTVFLRQHTCKRDLFSEYDRKTSKHVTLVGALFKYVRKYRCSDAEEENPWAIGGFFFQFTKRTIIISITVYSIVTKTRTIVLLNDSKI